MRKYTYLLIFLLAVITVSCQEEAKKNKQITVKNSLAIDRSFETVTIDIASLALKNKEGVVAILDAATQTEVVSQEIDSDGDGVVDQILFQPTIKANSEKIFDVILKEKIAIKGVDPDCYSRFVPERTDDYAWENNKVAFRTYGPVAQKMVEDGVKGGTLSSGIDAWLKRVEYPIINAWYKKTTDGTGSYHEDTGEGLDNFHVGVSRGVGGIAKKVDSTYHFSRNFVTWKNVHNGPIRTSFVLTYADWDANGTMITEQKHISLDYGSNFSRFEIVLKGTDTISAGLTLHNNEGVVAVNEANAWISHWETLDDSEIGTAIITPKTIFIGSEHYVTSKKDESNLFAHLKVNDNKVIYYAGFGWKKAGEFTTKEAWENHLNLFSQCLETPLVASIK